MANFSLLTVLTVASILALQSCSDGSIEGTTTPNEVAATNSIDPNHVSAETNQIVPSAFSTATVTESPVISLGSAIPISIKPPVPTASSATSSIVSKKSDHVSLFAAQTSLAKVTEEIENAIVPVNEIATATDISPATDIITVTDGVPATDIIKVTDSVPVTDSTTVSDISTVTDSTTVSDISTVTDSVPVTDTPETDISTVTDSAPVTDTTTVTDIATVNIEEEVAAVDYTPILEVPAEGELLPYASKIEFAWVVPAALIGALTGFEFALADASERLVFYRNDLITTTNCNNEGVCTFEVNSAEIPIPQGQNIWSVRSIGENISFNIAEATFTLDQNPDVQIASGLTMLSPTAGYIADSSSVYFSWEDKSKPNAVYDLQVYSDAARTQYVTGTNGVVFDANGVGSATSHIFSNDPSNGGTRYAVLSQWEDTNFKPESKQEILFEYTAHTKHVAPSEADFYGSAIGIRSLSNTPIDNTGVSGRNEKEASIGFTARGTMITAAKTYHVYRQDTLNDYSAGDGGTMRYALQADDGTGRPDGTNIATTGNYVALPSLHASQAAAAARYPGALWSTNGETGNALARFRKFDFTSVASVIPGQRYHIVMQNTSPDPVNNWISLNGNSYGPDGDFTKNILRSEDPNYTSGDGEIWVMDSTGSWVRRRGIVAVYEVYGDVVQGNPFYELSSTLDNETGNDRTFNVSGNNKARERITPVAAGQLCKTGIMAGRQSGSGVLNLDIKQGDVVLFSQSLTGFPSVEPTDNVTQISEKSAFVEIDLPSIPITASPDVYFEYSTNSSTSFEMTMQLDGSKVGYFEGSTYSGSKNTYAQISTDGNSWENPVNYSTPSSALNLSFYAKTCN